MLRRAQTGEDAFTALQKGEENGLLHFFNRFYSPLILYTSSIIQRQEVAQEIVSDAFHKLWINRNELLAAANVKAYLYRLASNAAFDYLRRQKVERNRSRLYAVYDAEEHTVLHKMIEAELYQRLYQALNGLPAKPRRIFELFYFQKKSIQEIANELGTTPDAVRSQKKRAMQLLRGTSGSLLTMILLFIAR